MDKNSTLNEVTVYIKDNKLTVAPILVLNYLNEGMKTKAK